MRHTLFIASAAFGFVAFGTGVLASERLRVEFSTAYPQRCQMEVLHPSSATADPCAPQIALFGLRGPTVMSGSVLDVDATGSLGKQRRDRLN